MKGWDEGLDEGLSMRRRHHKDLFELGKHSLRLSISMASTSRKRCLGWEIGVFWEMVRDNHKPLRARGKGCRDSPCLALSMEKGTRSSAAREHLGRMGGRMGMKKGPNCALELRAGQ